MMQIFLTIIIAQTIPDSNIVSNKPITKNYTKNVIICALTGIGLGAGSYYCNNKANSAYEEYKTANTIEKTIEAWNNVVKYDNLKTVFAVGSIVFIGGALYFQLKNIRTEKFSNVATNINICYTQNNKLILGIKKKI